MRRLPSVCTCLPLVCGMSLGQSPSGTADTEWWTYGHDPGGTRFSPLKQINNTNVQQLERAWTYEVASTPNSGIEAFESTPLMVDDVLYFTTQTSRAIAVDAETGKGLWVFDPFPGESGRHRPVPNRGAAYWEGYSPITCGGGDLKFDRRLFYVTLDARLFALDPRTGQPCQGFGDGGAINLRREVADKWPKERYDLTSPPTIYKDLVITDLKSRKCRRKDPVEMFAPLMSGRENWSGDSTPSPVPARWDTKPGKVIPGKTARGPTCGAS